MMHSIDLRGLQPSRAELGRLVPRAHVDVAAASTVAGTLISEVIDRGEIALLDQAERLDGVRPISIRVPNAQISAAVSALDAAVRDALEEAIDRVRAGSASQLPEPAVTRLGSGAEVIQRWQPLRRVGLYVPGGKAVYPSSVVMNVIPAQVAGVPSIAIASPPQKAFDGSVHPVILGAAGLLGVDEVYAMGGAGAIGAFAHGVPGIGLEAVELITGPGNVFVAAAKRIVRGTVGIDSEAGPTEILIIADSTAEPSIVAADLISQAEHDELAAAVLVTDSATLAAAVETELDALTGRTRHSGRVSEALRGQQSAIVLVDSLAAAADFSNAYAPEHLSLQVADPDALLRSIDSAGAIFLGRNSPVSLGDYLAGSNHVLPTGGQSRFVPGLGAYTFVRAQQVIRYNDEGLRAVAKQIRALSDAEDLPAHGDAVSARFRSTERD